MLAHPLMLLFCLW